MRADYPTMGRRAMSDEEVAAAVAAVAEGIVTRWILVAEVVDPSLAGTQRVLVTRQSEGLTSWDRRGMLEAASEMDPEAWEYEEEAEGDGS